MRRPFMVQYRLSPNIKRRVYIHKISARRSIRYQLEHITLYAMFKVWHVGQSECSAHTLQPHTASAHARGAAKAARVT